MLSGCDVTLPTSAIYDMTNCSNSNIEPASDGGLGFSVSMALDSLTSFLNRKFASSRLFAMRVNRSLLALHIQHIVSLSAKEEVVAINAQANIASVQHEHPLGNFSTKKGPGQPVGQPRFSHCSDAPIPAVRPNCSAPNNTSINTWKGGIGEESYNCSFFGKVSPPSPFCVRVFVHGDNNLSYCDNLQG